MNAGNQTYSTVEPSQAQETGQNGVNGQNRGIPHNRSSSAAFGGMQKEYTGVGAFTGARSPPKAKNTSHVPCKFYPYGTCQAGAACQFSHDLDPITQNAPCKYFAKGSCKFGQGCALAHILPDGRVINRPPRGQPFAYNRRTHMPQVLPPGPPSLLSMQANDMNAQQDFTYLRRADDPQTLQYSNASSMGMAALDTNGTTEADLNIGSPPRDSRLGASPSNRGLSVLDAPLPSSFDSQGISHAARHGPFASSVPPRFGIESPPSSLPSKAFMGNTGLRGLHDNAFRDTAGLDGMLHAAGSSPPTFEEPLSFSKRPLHSERLARPRMMMSSSLGTRPSQFQSSLYPDTSDPEESEDEGIGEDLLPSSLHELLPQEKLRRFSRNTVEDDGNPSFLSAGRRAISNGAAPQDSKVGSLSPISASPSRYTAMWASRSYGKSDAENAGPSAFGHVGSPLRPGAMRSSSLSMATSATGDTSPYAVGSPSKQASMSMLTQELQRSKLGESPKSATLPLPFSAPRTLSNGLSSGRSGLMERGISSSSLGRGETIEEEQGLFSMEEEDSEQTTPSDFGSSPKPGASTGSSTRRTSRTPMFGLIPGKSEATLGPIGGQRTTK